MLLRRGDGQAARPPKVLAFYTAGGELDHVLFAQQAIRALTANAAAHGYRFAATTDWDTLTDETLKDVTVVIWLNDQAHTAAQRAAFERYMNGGGAWLGFHVRRDSFRAVFPSAKRSPLAQRNPPSGPGIASSSAAAASRRATGHRCRLGSTWTIRRIR